MSCLDATGDERLMAAPPLSASGTVHSPKGCRSTHMATITLASEGLPGPSWTVDSMAGRVLPQNEPDSRGVYLVQECYCFYLRERLTVDRRNSIGFGKARMSCLPTRTVARNRTAGRIFARTCGTDKVAAEILDATRRGVVNRVDAVVAGWHALIG